MKATQEQNWTEVTHLFEAALELPPEERGVFLERACAGDAELRREVQSLIDADAEAGHFMGIPTEQETPTSAATVTSEDGATEPSVEAPEEQLKPGSPLGRYVVRERLGAGGMGVVYEAYDPELNRKIAIKLMRPGGSGSTSASEGRARLMREAQAMAQLSHPNAIAVYDVGTLGDQVFIAMEYVEGRTLTHWLAELKRPWREIANMFVHTGRGLAAAHAAGILHRDFKPDNVLVGKDGRPRVLDFGLARALFGEPEKRAPDDELAKADADGPSNLAPLRVVLTQPGRLMGTPAYMAPEQLMGERVDEKSDQYSFCAALFQGLYGILPFNADNFGALLEQIRLRKVTEVPNLNSVPSSVHQALLRGLSPNPADRFSSIEALLDKLEQQQAVPRRQTLIVAGLVIAVLLLLTTGGWWGLRTRNSKQGVLEDRSIAVLPFVDMSPGRDQQYFSEGIAEEIINGLSQNEGLQVVGRTSSFSFRDNHDLREIGQKLNVTHVLEGSVRREEGMVRITAQLIDVASGYHVWSQSFSREMRSVLALEDDIAREVVVALRGKLVPNSWAKAAARASVNPEAYDVFLRASNLLRLMSVETVRQSIPLLRKALTLEPGLTPAWTGLAIALWWSIDLPSAEGLDSAREAVAAANRAVELDADWAIAYSTRALVRWDLQWDWAGATADLARAMALNPRDPIVLSHRCHLERASGKLASSTAACRQATQLDPLSVSHWNQLTNTYLASGEYVLARAAVAHAFELSPDSRTAQINRCAIAVFSGDGAARELCSRLPSENQRLFWAALATFDQGDHTQADRALAALIAKNGEQSPAWIAYAYAWRGENDSAFEWLERAYALRWPKTLTNIKVAPALRKIRDDPRFTALLKKMNLPQD